jgi:hypothetical protein
VALRSDRKRIAASQWMKLGSAGDRLLLNLDANPESHRRVLAVLAYLRSAT